MSSYTKQLMETAGQWLAVNKDPDDPFLKIPDHVAIRDQLERDREHIDGTFRRAVRIHQHPYLLATVEPELTKLSEINAQITNANIELEHGMHDVERNLNTVTDGVGKYQEASELNGRFMLAWARDGYNVFELSPDFVAAMLLTDSREINIERARLPFKGLLMLIPDGFASDGNGQSYTRIQVSTLSGRDASMLGAADRITGILSKTTPEIAKDVIGRAMTAHNDARRTKNVPTWLDASPSKLTDESADDRLYVYANNGRWGMFHCSKRTGLSWNKVESAIEEMIDDEGDASAMRTIEMLVFSTLAYINAISGAVEPVVETSSKKRKVADHDGPKRWTVGRTIKLDPNLVRVVRGGSREIAFRLKHRHIVRAHFRQQAYGPNHTLRKEIYINAFWKGPEEGAKLVHTYKPALKSADDDSGPAAPDPASSSQQDP